MRRRRFDLCIRALRLDHVGGFILDLGGGAASFFVERFERRERLVLLDIDLDNVHQARRRAPGLKVLVADGGALPLATGSMQATICNSVIEHAGDPASLAREIERVSRSYFVQTPNGRFPLEMHSLVPIPLYPWLRRLRLGRFVCHVFGASYEYLESVRYIDAARLRRLFPAAEFARERVLGLSKSFYMIMVSRDDRLRTAATR